MVAKISIPQRLLSVLNYNEKKVKAGKAELIGAAGYLKDAETMNFSQKLQVLENRNSLNVRATTRTIHVSLNFDPSEKLAPNTLLEIASNYMERLGFEGQPFLVYQHSDAGHPHIHIVSTLIREDGSRINTHNLGRLQSEKARKEIEEKFKLVRAERSHKEKSPSPEHLRIESLKYGKSPLKDVISRVVCDVVKTYNYTSLPELNAALAQFNVIADRGKEGSRVFNTGGLVYRMLDEKGQKVGVPIKASRLGQKPTLSHLEKRFSENASTRDVLQQKLIQKIECCFESKITSLNSLMNQLRQHQVYTVLRKSKDRKLFGITFVDIENRSVFNGSKLAREYSIGGIQKRINGALGTPKLPSKRRKERLGQPVNIPSQNQTRLEMQPGKLLTNKTLELLFPTHTPFESLPPPFRKKRKRRKKRNPAN
jgi:hypothetical protein